MNHSAVKKTKSLTVLAALISTIISPSSATASDAIAPGDSDSRWVVGASVGSFKNPYNGENSDSGVIPTIRYNGERVFIKEGSLNIHVTRKSGFSAGLKFALDAGFLVDLDNYKNNPELAGLDERDATVLGGIYVNHDTDIGRLSLNALADAASEHNGRTVSLKYTFDLKAGGWNINPELGAEWLSADYVNHYVGISESEVTNSRSQYRAGDEIVAFAGVRARYELTDNWDINLSAGFTKLGSEFKESPIIEDDAMYQASFGVNYNF